ELNNAMFRNFPDLTTQQFVEKTVEELKQQLGNDKVVLGLSGGVDSSVTAVLINKAIGKNLYCIFVNTGLLRKNEFEDVQANYKDYGLQVKGVDASAKFLKDLEGVDDPEQKRKIIGRNYIEIFNEEAQKIADVKWLGQGTIYPDVIESQNSKSKTIKSHHNVGGLPKDMKFQLCEPLRMLYKDEVRLVGRELGMDEQHIGRHPFPGPGLGVRILGAITAEKVRILQDADKIFIDALRAEGLYDKVWQAGAILLPVKSVGVCNDERTYDNAIVLRAVHSVNAMTADCVHLPYEFLDKVSYDIITKVQGVNRVVYDISRKPPATIEWE
ncbi:MAG: glutamine-hydrolyzing GMP synthase, partial [Bacteroidales bacterium]|nr:glutamine-hydrolyzing GMP synthase [Bacteroidales bacterium]